MYILVGSQECLLKVIISLGDLREDIVHMFSLFSIKSVIEFPLKVELMTVTE